MPSRIPKTPFSTPLSGSARMTEQRICNIFQGQKKRPAILVMVLAAVLILLCGSLVAFRTTPVSPMVVMDVQYYDTNQNYIEIPGLAWPMDSQPNQAVEEINQVLAGLKAEYQAVLSWDQDQLDGLSAYENQCLFYPSTTSRYLNLMFFRNTFQTDLNTGHILSLVYDLQEGQLVTVEEALELAGVTQQGLYEALSAQYDPHLAQDHPEAAICIQNQSLEGFRIREDGGVVFYLTARVDDAEDSALDFVSGSDNLYIWQGGSFTCYDQYGPGGLVPLVPAGETDQLSPPLWCQWYFDGGQPEGGFTSPGGTSVNDPSVLQAVLAAADSSLLDSSGPLVQTVLGTLSGDSLTLAAVTACDSYPRYVFALGVVDRSTGALSGPIFQAASSGSAPHVVTFTRADGTHCLLYTVNGEQQGFSYGQAGLVTFDGQNFTWEWPVEGDVRDVESQAYADYQAFWAHRKPLLSLGGVEVFTENTQFGPYQGSVVQWVPENSYSFYPSGGDNLVTGATWQVRKWLEDFTRDSCNPWDASNASALWRILSLEPSEPMDLPAQRETPQTLYLLAQADNQDSLYFAARLVFDPLARDGQYVWAEEFGMGTLEEVAYLLQPSRSEEFYSLLLDYYRDLYPDRRVYFAADQPDGPQVGDVRLNWVSYAGSHVTYETVGAAYWVDTSFYTTVSGILGWHAQDGRYVVLGQSAYDGSFYEVRGSASYPTGNIDALILQISYQLQDIEVSLWRDGYPAPVGPGNWRDLFHDLPSQPTVEILEDWEPIYSPGDRWERCTVDGFTALRYYSAAQDRYITNRIETTRTDLCTFRGLRVGDSRAQVQEAYAACGIYDTPCWNEPEGDYLWYCENEAGWGACVLFFFEGDTVIRIVLNNMLILPIKG